MTELRDAVDDLTLPKRVKVMQDEEVVTVQVPPLLHQLDEIIRSDIGLTASGASLAHERNILDADALHKMMQISSQVRDWLRELDAKDAPLVRNTSAALRLWYVAALGANLDDSAYHIRTLRSWAGYIRGKLDPARERELPDPCPECKAGEWWRDGVRYLHPLVVKYRLGPTLVDGATAVCRACDASWNARELAYMLEQAV